MHGPKSRPCFAKLGKLVELVRVGIQQPLDDWRVFTFKPLIPESEGDYRLEHRSGTYTITPNGGNDGQIEIGRELDHPWDQDAGACARPNIDATALCPESRRAIVVQSR